MIFVIITTLILFIFKDNFYLYLYGCKDYTLKDLMHDIIPFISFAFMGLLVMVVVILFVGSAKSVLVVNDFLKNKLFKTEPEYYTTYELTDDTIYTTLIDKDSDNGTRNLQYVGFTYKDKDINHLVYALEDRVAITTSDNPHLEIETYSISTSFDDINKYIWFPVTGLYYGFINESVNDKISLNAYKLYVSEDQIDNSVRFINIYNN